MIKTIAALFVAKDGPYFGVPGVDPWDISRDARSYIGPYSVVAHPPCERWGKYWSGGPNPNAARRMLGDDNGCFASALLSVRVWCGVLEHPEASHAFATHGLLKPPRAGGWVINPCGGWTCCVEQGRYGHAARKRTWLYLRHCWSGKYPPDLLWGTDPRVFQRMDPGFHSKEKALEARRAAGWKAAPRLTATQRIQTPPAFRDLLISLARWSIE